MRWASGNRAGATLKLRAQRTSVGMREGHVERVAEHVVEEAQQATQRLRSPMEHMFARLWSRSDGTGVAQRILQPRRWRVTRTAAGG